ncbi:MAG: hypothetical protein ACO3VO_00220 [Ilumatobacteraceae bacterium]
MAAFGFNENDAKRIGKAVRAVERDPTKVRLGGPEADGAAPGVRLMIAKHEGAGWPTGSTAVVTLYNGELGSVATAMTMVAYNHYIKFSDDANCTSRWVALGHNGFAWHPVDSQADCGTCISLIGGVDFRVFPGYTHTNTQMLGHDGGGCIKWYDIFTCATASS